MRSSVILICLIMSWIAPYRLFAAHLRGSSTDSSSTLPQLPSPTHPIAFGYYFEDGKYGDFNDEVAGYTDLYRAGKYAYPFSTDEEPLKWLPEMERRMRAAWQRGRKICLALEWGSDARTDDTEAVALLKMMKPFWDRVIMVEVADEPPWNKAETERRLRRLRELLKAHGLVEHPLGVVYTRRQLLEEDAIFADGLDFVGIECYLDPPGSEQPEANVKALIHYVNQGKKRVPANKNLVMIMMAYARNGAWKSIRTLEALQTVVYLLAHDDPRVTAITMFSYGRPSGTREHPELKPYHEAIGRALGIGKNRR